MSDLGVLLEHDPETPSLDRMWIAFDHEYRYNIVHMGHVAALLETVHPRLPATFDRWFRTALSRVARVWDVDEASEWLERYGDWILEMNADALADGEEPPWPIEIIGEPESVAGGAFEFRVKDLRLPALRREPLAESTVRRLRRSMPERVGKIMDLTAELVKASKEAPKHCYPEGFFDEVAMYEHRDSPPLLVVVGERYDAIERTWDEENMAMAQLGEPSLPYVALPFDATDDEDLLRVHRDFTAICRVYSLAAQIVALLPEHDPSSLAEVLREADE